jgi:LPS export ABC transporter permease LptF
VLVYPRDKVFRTLDRYLLREIATPFVIALVVLTFVLEIPPILRQAETLVAQGVALPTILHVLILLLPQALSLTIPMAVLLAILVGFGRLSADREFVAMQACGVSLMRLLRPIALIAVVATAATAYQTIVALPNANQTFREITFGEFAAGLQARIKPRVFFDDIPNKVIYVRDLPREGGWRDVFVAESIAGDTVVYFAREGRVTIDRDKRLVQLQLTQGTSHWTTLGNADAYEGAAFEQMSIMLDPTSVFPPPPAKGAPEMTFAELRQRIAEERSRGGPANEFRFMVQQKLSLPATCPILALIGLALGATNRKDGKLASFALGFGVIFVYYVMLYAARSLALGGRLSPDWAPWIPNVLMGIAAVLLTAWRARSGDRPIRFTVPAFWRRSAAAAPSARPAARAERPRVVVVVRLPHLNVPLPRLLDLYVSREYLRVFLLGVFALLGIFYISTFIDLADKMFRGEATMSLVMRYFFFQTPQFVYFVIPMAVLMATLVTVGVLTKNSEMTVMRACGISLYRSALPLLLFGATAGAVLFGMQEQVLATTNREADRLNRLIRGWPPLTAGGVRQWVVGTTGDMYRFDSFDPGENRFSRLWVFRVDHDAWDLSGITFSERALLAQTGESPSALPTWLGHDGWDREFVRAPRPGGKTVVRFAPFEQRSFPLDAPAHFSSGSPAADLMADMMTYAQLRQYVGQLQTGGAYAVPYMVALQRKIAFPFVTLIMTLLAIPFAMTTGRRGALYGIGVGIVLAIVYWVALSLFGALGEGGVLPPMLAAWAPNILFGAAAAYMILTVRT